MALSYMLIMQIMSPTRTCRPLADWRSAFGHERPQRCRATRITGPVCFSLPPPLLPPHREMYASGGGLLMTPINAPHLLSIKLGI